MSSRPAQPGKGGLVASDLDVAGAQATMHSAGVHMVRVVGWHRFLNRLNGGLACCAAGLVLGGLAAVENADLVAFQAARPCAAQESPADGCYAWLTGRVAAIGARKLEDESGPGRVDINLTVDLPVGQRTVLVATTLLPPGKPQVGDSIDAKLWRGQVTDVRLAGVTVGTVSRPETRFLFLLDGAGVVSAIGMLLLVAYAIDRRARYA